MVDQVRRCTATGTVSAIWLDPYGDQNRLTSWSGITHNNQQAQYGSIVLYISGPVNTLTCMKHSNNHYTIHLYVSRKSMGHTRRHHRATKRSLVRFHEMSTVHRGPRRCENPLLRFFPRTHNLLPQPWQKSLRYAHTQQSTERQPAIDNSQSQSLYNQY